jgi:hypothetical protein
MIAKRTAVTVYLNAEGDDRMIAGGIKQPRQDNQNCGDDVQATTYISWPPASCDGPRVA